MGQGGELKCRVPHPLGGSNWVLCVWDLVCPWLTRPPTATPGDSEEGSPQHTSANGWMKKKDLRKEIRGTGVSLLPARAWPLGSRATGIIRGIIRYRDHHPIFSHWLERPLLSQESTHARVRYFSPLSSALQPSVLGLYNMSSYFVMQIVSPCPSSGIWSSLFFFHVYSFIWISEFNLSTSLKNLVERLIGDSLNL